MAVCEETKLLLPRYRYVFVCTSLCSHQRIQKSSFQTKNSEHMPSDKHGCRIQNGINQLVAVQGSPLQGNGFLRASLTSAYNTNVVIVFQVIFTALKSTLQFASQCHHDWRPTALAHAGTLLTHAQKVPLGGKGASNIPRHVFRGHPQFLHKMPRYYI